MLQRLGIAQAVLGEPQLLILDEVTSGLDPVGRRDIRSLLLERKSAGATIFFSSHELTEVARLCNRIILVDEGRKLEEHPAKELLDRLCSFFIVCRSGDPSLPIPEGAEVEPVQEGLRRVTLRTNEAFLCALETLRSKGIEVVEAGTNRGSLEEYFVEAIGGKVT